MRAEGFSGSEPTPSARVGDGIGSSLDSEHDTDSAVDPFALLREMNAERRSLNRLIAMSTNGAKSKLRRYFGSPDDDAEARKDNKKRASDIVNACLKRAEGRTGKQAELPSGSKNLMSLIDRYILIFDALAPSRRALISDMETIVKRFPIESWRQGVRGLGPLGVAVILAHSGNPSRYPMDGHNDKARAFTKRLGMAPKDAYKTGKTGGRIWPQAAYTDIFGMVRDPLIRQQWRGGKDDEVGVAIGPYGEIYRDVKIYSLGFGKSKSHADRHARAMATKAVCRDLWVAWRKEIGAPKQARRDLQSG